MRRHGTPNVSDARISSTKTSPVPDVSSISKHVKMGGGPPPPPGGGVTSARNGAGAVKAPRQLTVGVLALQGAFANHVTAFRSLAEEFSLHVIQVRTPTELSECDAVVLPGGESTTMNILLSADGESLLSALRHYVHVLKKPVWGTCAGCILLANTVTRSEFGGSSTTASGREGQEGVEIEGQTRKGTISGMDLVVSRNHFGRQADSFEAPLSPKGRLQDYVPAGFPGVCIRAPGIVDVAKDSVEVLATLPSPVDGGKEVVAAAAQDRLLVSIFHPELTGQNGFHRFFLEAFVLPSIS